MRCIGSFQAAVQTDLAAFDATACAAALVNLEHHFAPRVALLHVFVRRGGLAQRKDLRQSICWGLITCRLS